MLTFSKLYFDTAAAHFFCAATGAPIYPGQEMALVQISDGEQRFEFHVCQSVRARTDQQIMAAIIERQYLLTCQTTHPTEFQHYLRQSAQQEFKIHTVSTELDQVNS